MRSRWLGLWLLVPLLLIGCGDDDGGSAAPPANPVQAGIAEVLMPAPVGIGTVGYFGASVSAEPSPFSKIYPATTRVHGQPSFRVVVISRGPGKEVVFIRADMVGVF